MLKESAEQRRETEFFLQNSVSLNDLLNERPAVLCHLFNPGFKLLLNPGLIETIIMSTIQLSCGVPFHLFQRKNIRKRQ